jgi:hypothetical protein
MTQLARLLRIAVLASFCFVRVQDAQQSETFNHRADSGTIIRFFFQPAYVNSYHPALLFQVVGDGDIRLNTAPIRSDGRTAFVSLNEVQNLINGLNRLELNWKESHQIQAPDNYWEMVIRPEMEIKLFSKEGTRIALVNPKQICSTLETLDSALKQPRALWEFQLFRAEDGCKVPGLKRDAYPDHYFN